jgi:hypothetical protein
MVDRVMVERAFGQARQLDHGWVGPEHFLLALLATPNAASDALAELGVTYARFREHLGALVQDPDLPPLKAREGMGINPAGHEVMGWAGGFAAAFGLRSPRPEHWLVAMLYMDDRGAMWLHSFDVSIKTAMDALARHGIQLPDFAPGEYQAWRGARHVYVSRDELQPIVDLLSQMYPAGSEWKWGFNWVGRPRRGRITAEEGIDLEAVVVQARRRDDGGYAGSNVS